MAQAAQLFVSSLRTIASQKILGLRQVVILAVLHASGGELDFSKLAKAANISKTSTTNNVDALAVLGFVKRLRSAPDKRFVLVQMTQAAKDVMSNAIGE